LWLTSVLDFSQPLRLLLNLAHPRRPRITPRATTSTTTVTTRRSIPTSTPTDPRHPHPQPPSPTSRRARIPPSHHRPKNFPRLPNPSRRRFRTRLSAQQRMSMVHAEAVRRVVEARTVMEAAQAAAPPRLPTEPNGQSAQVAGPVPRRLHGASQTISPISHPSSPLTLHNHSSSA
jgi:hypothetical protein